MRIPTPFGTAGLKDPHEPVISDVPVNMHPSFRPVLASPLHRAKRPRLEPSSRRGGLRFEGAHGEVLNRSVVHET